MSPVPQVLLLGCGDIRNALVSAPALRQLQNAKPSSSSGKAKKQQQQQQIEIHLNDLSDVILARDVVLLCITASITPSCDDDLQYLWGVWFNAVLSQTHRQRLDQLLEQVSMSCGLQHHLHCNMPVSGLLWQLRGVRQFALAYSTLIVTSSVSLCDAASVICDEGCSLIVLN
jgi:hypothetical protein